MNCVDKLDQNKKSCQIDRKSKKWWHRIFFHFIDIAVVNAHVIYTQSTGTTITMKNFRRDISRELLNKTIVCKRQSKSTKKSRAEINTSLLYLTLFVWKNQLISRKYRQKEDVQNAAQEKKKLELNGCVQYVTFHFALQ